VAGRFGDIAGRINEGGKETHPAAMRDRLATCHHAQATCVPDRCGQLRPADPATHARELQGVCAASQFGETGPRRSASFTHGQGVSRPPAADPPLKTPPQNVTC